MKVKPRIRIGNLILIKDDIAVIKHEDWKISIWTKAGGSFTVLFKNGEEAGDMFIDVSNRLGAEKAGGI
jgi:hypothetical protein